MDYTVEQEGPCSDRIGFLVKDSGEVYRSTYARTMRVSSSVVKKRVRRNGRPRLVVGVTSPLHSKCPYAGKIRKG